MLENDIMLKNKVKKKKVAFVLTGGFAIGGAETRFANTFKYLKSNNTDFEYFLILSGKRFTSLCNHNILSKQQHGIIINCPRIYLRFLSFNYNKAYLKSMGEDKTKFRVLIILNKFFHRIKRWFNFIYNIVFLYHTILIKKISVIHPITEGTPPSGIVKQIMPGIKLVSSFLSLNPTWHKKGFYYLYSSQVFSLKKSDFIDILGLTYLEKFKKLDNNSGKYKTSISPCSFINTFYTSTEKKPIIVFSGRLNNQKNPMLFVRAAKIILEKEPKKAHFLILGSGPLKHKLEDYITKNKISNNIEIVYTFNQSEVLSESIIFCSLQSSDNYPSQSLLQAMHSENVVIATNVGETKKLIKEDETGFLINPDEKELANKILMVLNNPGIRKRISFCAAKFVNKKHRIEFFADYLEEIYHNLFKK